MIVKIICKKVISDITGENLGSESPWLKIGKEYIILMMSYSKHHGFYIALETESESTAMFHLNGFEFASNFIPSNWITKTEKVDGNVYVNMLPASWNYESFFDDLEDEEEYAMKLFHEEAEKIYREEEEYEASKNK